MGCNMRCKHCGSSCENSLPDELTTAEALNFADMCGEVSLSWITLSGGEPLIRNDLFEIIKRLNYNNVLVNVITNGWLMTDKIAKSLKSSGISTVAISLDGTKEIHDEIRKPGSYKRAQNAFKILKENGIYTGCITTILNQNINILENLKDELVTMEVGSWQLQIGLLMGNFSNNPHWMITPEQMENIVNFCCETQKEGKIIVYPADCIGYYDQKIINTFGFEHFNPIWDGCNAGVNSFGLLQNGNVVGCTSMRSKEFVEGNIRQKGLKEIWNDENNFSWRRNFSQNSLKGDCKICKYSTKCLGGCFNTRLTTNGDINSENLYCTHNLRIKNFRKKLLEFNSINILLEQSQKMICENRHQEALLLLNRAKEINFGNKKIEKLMALAKTKLKSSIVDF